MNTNHHNHTAAGAPRRGSVLIFALAILAVLALLGATYVTRSNLDRVSAEAAVRRNTLSQQPEIAINHAGALLTADLFGNKLVTKATPFSVEGQDVETTGGTSSGSIRIWPSMFEDGEHWDYPSVDEIDYTRNGTAPAGYEYLDGYTFARAVTETDSILDEEVRPQAKLRYDPAIGAYQTARPDDAWLAATEPVRYDGLEPVGSYVGGWDSWPQISNIRSAYSWDGNADGDGNGAWVRGDGRYADLARFFNTVPASTRDRGDPSADLLDRANEAAPFYNPVEAADEVILGPAPRRYNSSLLGVEQREIYRFQMQHLAERFEIGNSYNPDSDIAEFEPVDERFWADTDGDGRPDARWSIIDALDGQGDMRWVVAMRIADSSAAVNVNTSIEGLPTATGGTSEWQVYGDGATPMDIELSKLFLEASTNTSASSAASGTSLNHPDVQSITPGYVSAGLRRHFLQGLGLTTDMVESTDPFTSSMANFFDTPSAGETDNSGLRDFIGWKPGIDDDFGYLDDVTDFPTTRAQREAYWRLYASRPNAPFISGGRRYSLKEEIDLRANLGANYPGVKSIETNFDGPDAGTFDSRLPGALDDDYPDRLSLGPMRSSESSNAVSRTERMNVDLPDPGISAGDYEQIDRILRIQRDVRRSLTVASGASARSVVPALGEREVLPGRLKPLVNAGSWTDNGGGQYGFQSTLDVREAFEAFTWALAPLAANRPLMGALASNWVNKYESELARNPAYHYGGGQFAAGPRGPAEAWATDSGAGPNSGPTYALFRAASLAVNLKDAVDREFIGSAPVDVPTIARLIPTPVTDQVFTNEQLAGATLMTTRFAQGDIDDADNPTGAGAVNGTPVIPTPFVDQRFGVSFVGLDRQPFISEAFAFCMYQYGPVTGSAGSLPASVDINAGGPETSHAIIAVELINPWDSPIDLSTYSLMLTDGTYTFTLEDLNGVILPGERHVVIGHNAAGNAEALLSVDDLEANIAAATTERVETVEEIDTTFVDWDRADTAVLLYQNNPDGGQLLVDRMRNPGDTDFPAAKPDDTVSMVVVDFPTTAPLQDQYGAWYAFASNLSRSSEFPTTGSFPATVLERPGLNAVHVASTDDSVGNEGWHVSPPSAISHFQILQNDPPADLADALTLGTMNAAGGTESVPLVNFQLFVPNAPLVALSELGQISAFAHTYRHSSADAPTVGAQDANPASRWTTVSEQLGESYHLNYDGNASAVPTTAAAANPYLGVLDPTRFILGADGDLNVSSASPDPIADLPDALAVPLALRVFDAFEVLADNLANNNALVEGRININTAPKRVLATLPLVLPVDYTTNAIATNLTNLTTVNAYARLNAILQYRDQLGTNWNSTTNQIGWDDADTTAQSVPSQLTGLAGLRNRYIGSAAQAAVADVNESHRYSRGFSSAGELAILGAWTTGANSPQPTATAGQAGFLELAIGGSDNSLNANQRNALDVRRPESGFAFDGSNFEGADDVEERLALYRAVSNLTSSRSDVYHVWYIARAYSPAAIESVEIDPMLTTDDQRAELLNDLPIAYQERGFVVLDRSNVRRPTDRPRVLLRVVLESEQATN